MNRNNINSTSNIRLEKKDDYPFSWFVSAFLAKMMSTSAKVLLPIQRFWPSKCQPPGTFQKKKPTWLASKGHISSIEISKFIFRKKCHASK